MKYRIEPAAKAPRNTVFYIGNDTGTLFMFTPNGMIVVVGRGAYIGQEGLIAHNAEKGRGVTPVTDGQTIMIEV